MPFGFNVHTPQDRSAMLSQMGLANVMELFADVPASIRLGRRLNLPPALGEAELERDMRAMAARNATTLTHTCFAGAGAYDHHVPAVVDAIVARGEFLTAYTPYQPEMSQGLLQALFEFQTLVGRLLGHAHANCSVYDGATALAEACWMMCSHSGKRVVVVASALWPDAVATARTYLVARGVELRWVGTSAGSGALDLSALQLALSPGDVAGVAVQSPNAWGVIENIGPIAAAAHAANSLLCVSVNPMLCALVDPPGHLGADIVTAEGQALGLHLNAGGPYVGMIATRKSLERHLPGRLVGRVHDLNGKLGYALVKEDREQHVARERATSHICSNQALNAIRVAVFLALLGEQRLVERAEMCHLRASALRAMLLQLPGVGALATDPFFNEFSVKLPMSAALFCERMWQHDLLAGSPLSLALCPSGQGLLVAATEQRNDADLAAYISAARTVLACAAPAAATAAAPAPAAATQAA